MIITFTWSELRNMTGIEAGEFAWGDTVIWYSKIGACQELQLWGSVPDSAIL